MTARRRFRGNVSGSYEAQMNPMLVFQCSVSDTVTSLFGMGMLTASA